MTKAEQEKRTRSAFESGRKRIGLAFQRWGSSVVSGWTPGTARLSKDQRDRLRSALSDAYRATAKDVVGPGYDYGKQDGEDDPYNEIIDVITVALGIEIAKQVVTDAKSIIDTVLGMMRAAADAGDAFDGTTAQKVRVAVSDLTSRLNNHSIIVAVTGSNWTTNASFSTAVLSVTDRLGDSVEKIATLISEGNESAARRLSRQVLKIARLPTSVTQGDLLGYLNDQRDRLATPSAQGRIVAGLRARAEKLGKQEKQWDAIFHNTRPSHAAAHGQTKPVDEPFELDGGLLQYPMDGSLGASLSEIVNCQCGHFYV